MVTFAMIAKAPMACEVTEARSLFQRITAPPLVLIAGREMQSVSEVLPISQTRLGDKASIFVSCK